MKIHQVSRKLDSLTHRDVHIQIIQKEKSLFIWAETVEERESPKRLLGSLALAILTPYDPIAVGSTLLKPQMDNLSESLAKKLATKFKIPILCSLNISPDEVKPVQSVLNLVVQDLLNNKPIQGVDVGR